MDTGKPGGVGRLLTPADELLDVLVRQGGHHLHVKAHGLLPEQARFQIHLVQEGPLLSGEGLQLLQHDAVAAGHTGAGAQQAHRHF